MTRYLKNMEKEITIENQVEEIAIIAQFIEELGMSLHLPSGITQFQFPRFQIEDSDNKRDKHVGFVIIRNRIVHVRHNLGR